jgi:hypothetical protein
MATKILFQTKLTDIEETDLEMVGVLRFEEDGRVFQWVKNTATTALTAKQPVCYEVALAGSIAMFQSVLSPATADLMMAAGIAVTAIAASGGKMYGWTQVRGRFDGARVLAVSGTAGAVGEEYIGANGTTTLARATAAGTAPKYQKNYTLLEVVSASTGAVVAADVYVNCL